MQEEQIEKLSIASLRELLSWKITTIPDFIFIRVRTILSPTPKTKSQNGYKNYDVYELEVIDDEREPHYVIERSAL